MKVIARKVWEEPAVCIGLLVTLGLLAWNVLGDDSWDLESIVAILAPLVSSLGIRQTVIPNAKLDELTAPPVGTTYAGPSR